MTTDTIDLDSQETRDFQPGGGIPLLPSGDAEGQTVTGLLLSVEHRKSKKDFTSPGWYEFVFECVAAEVPGVREGQKFKVNCNLPTSVTNQKPRNRALREMICALAGADPNSDFKATPYLTSLCKATAQEAELDAAVTCVYKYTRDYTRADGTEGTAPVYDYEPVRD